MSFDGAASTARSAVPASGHPDGKVAVTAELLSTWLGFADLQRRALDAMRAELARTSQHVENATIDLSDRFRRLAEKALEQSEHVAEITTLAGSVSIGGEPMPIGGEPMPIGRLIGSLQDMIGDRMTDILTLSHQAASMAHRLDALQNDVAELEASIGDIDIINRRAKAVALDATAEASRMGETGRTFAMVAKEVHDLSRATGELAARMRAKVAAVTEGVGDGHAILRRIADTGLPPQRLAKERVDETIQGLAVRTAHLQSVLEKAAVLSSDLSSTITQVVTGLQFQDLAKQRIEAINDSLAVMSAGLSELEDRIRAQVPADGGAMVPREWSREWLNHLIDRFTLGEMRERFVRKLLLDGTALDENGVLDVDAGRGDSSGDDIELF